MSGKLYIVGTPIGNLEDFSPRAVRILDEVDFIAAEDTRVTLKLLNHFGIKKELISYYEHNKNDKGEWIINRILSGQSCALVSDAGMPAISDPGEDLVRAAHENGVIVESVPGPSALITALSISGMPSGRFTFEGFLSVNKSERKSHLEEIKNDVRTVIFYEAPHKLLATLRDIYAVFGERNIALVREITKIHETVFRTTLSESIAYYEQNNPRGEYVLIINGAEKSNKGEEYTIDEAVKLARKLMQSGESASAAAKEAAAESGIKKGEIYRNLLK